MRDKILKILIGGAGIVIIMMIRYPSLPSPSQIASAAMREFKKITGNYDRKKRRLQSSNRSLGWEKIGKVSGLFIYPVKSSSHPLIPHINSCDFYDYGMCIDYNNTYLYDGMFIVYNETKAKFEDVRTYPSLKFMAVEQIEDRGEVMLYITDENDDENDDNNENRITVNVRYNRTLVNRLVKETWTGNQLFHAENEQVNRRLHGMLGAVFDEDIILTQMIPNNRFSTHRIKENWSRFVQGYQTLREDGDDNTGKLITLPRFVLMTHCTNMRYSRISTFITPNVVIEEQVSSKITPFEETNWKWIKLGDQVILKNVTPVPRDESLDAEDYPHLGIYCGLWAGGRVRKNDDVFLSFAEWSPPARRLKLPRI